MSTPTAPTLVHALTMSGLEVEEVTPLGDGLDGVVVAEIVAAEKHPEADRLQVCKVDAGQGAALQIVCGAPNARVGHQGAAGEGRRDVAERHRRSRRPSCVASTRTACCVRPRSSASTPTRRACSNCRPMRRSASPLADYLGLPDASIELKITPNRPDCLGLVRAGARCRRAVRQPRPGWRAVIEASIASAARRGVRLEAGADAPRYLGRIIEGIDAKARHAAVDGRASAPRRPASDQRRRRHHQLRDARTRPAAARVRQRHASGRRRRAPCARTAKRSSCSTATRRSSTKASC